MLYTDMMNDMHIDCCLIRHAVAGGWRAAAAAPGGGGPGVAATVAALVGGWRAGADAPADLELATGYQVVGRGVECRIAGADAAW